MFALIWAFCYHPSMETTLLSIVEKLGVPMGILLIFSYGFWQSVVWFGNRVVVPLQEGHMKFLGNLEETLKTLANGQEQLARELGTLTALIGKELSRESRTDTPSSNRRE